MKTVDPPGPPPRAPKNLHGRRLPIVKIPRGAVLHRIHRTEDDPLNFGRHMDAARRHRWDAPDASYGVCYLAVDGHIAFAETLLRDLDLASIQLNELAVRSLNLIAVVEPIRLVDMSGAKTRALGADASVVHASYSVTQEWSAALHAHPDRPDGIRYHARHDDSGFSIALFDRAGTLVLANVSVALTDASLATTLGSWLDRYGLGLTS